MIEPTRYAEGRAMLLAGLRRQHAFADAETTIPDAGLRAVRRSLRPTHGRRETEIWFPIAAPGQPVWRPDGPMSAD